MSHPRSLLVTGATGFIGAALVTDRLEKGDRVAVLSRNPAAARAQFPASVTVYGDLDGVPADAGFTAIVNLAGAPTAAGRWSPARKRALLESRLEITRAVGRLVARLEPRPEALLSASAVGYYGDRGDAVLTEAAGPQDRFMSDLCRLWEEEALRTPDVRVVMLRIGVVFDWSGGPLPLLAGPTRWGLGAVYGSGRQWLPWIHLEDVVGAIGFVLDQPACAGPLNLVAPEPVRQAEFADALARALNRPRLLRLPAWSLRLGFGELADIFLAGQRAVPAALQELGFRFARPDLAAVLSEGRA